MPTKLYPHWIPVHPDQRDHNWLAQWQPRFIKVVFSSDDQIPQLDVALRCAQFVIARNHPVSENWERRGIRDAAAARQMAQTHAAFLGRLWDNVRKRHPTVDRERILWEGLNEPREWSDEPAGLTAIYYAEFVRRMAAQGLKTVALNIGVGWPGNGGVRDAPPIWKPYEPIIEAIATHGGYLGVHEYWGSEGPQAGWRWLAGRYTQCPYQVPILVTECGIDAAVIRPGQHYGYRGLTPDGHAAARRYIEHLAWYDARLHEDVRVEGGFIFTYDFSPGWATFDIRNHEFMPLWLAYVAAQPQHDHGRVVKPTPVIAEPIRVLQTNGLVRVMELEEYLRGVVPSEVPALWPAEAVKAQAVVARSYARAALAAPRHAPDANVCTREHCQVYNELRAHPASDAAIKSTAGEVLLYSGKVIPAYYSASCGGRTVSNATVWGGEPLPYLQPVDCPCNKTQRGHGVGMCQWGAHRMAQQGYDYKAILKHYYKGVRLSSEPDTTVETLRRAVREFIDQLNAALERLIRALS